MRVAGPTCATVWEPAEAALYELWGIVSRASRGDVKALTGIFEADDPLVLCVIITAFCVLLCWAWSLLTNNHSHVDRMWSIVPISYAFVFAREELWTVYQVLRRHAAQGLIGRGLLGAVTQVTNDIASTADVRLLVMCALVTQWGLRLTYNFYRKGGYSYGFEDYRWAVVRTLFPNRFLLELFNFVFVALAQHVMCLLICCPMHVAYVARRALKGDAIAAAAAARSGTNQPVSASGARPWNDLDVVAAAMFVAMLLFEALADQQQWAFQAEKYRLIKARLPRKGDYARGFLTRGLFRFTRHPNWFGEFMLWWAMYVFAVAAWPGCPVSWPIVGPISLTVLFAAGSVWITEKISLSKYPEYKQYQATTSALVPWLPGPPLPDKSA